MAAPEITKHEVRAMDPKGRAMVPFVQKCLNRLAVGSVRYGRSREADKQGDMIATAMLRLQRARETGDREHLIDACNFAFLAWDRMTDVEASPMHGGEHSPGLVGLDGKIERARGMFAHYNGSPYVPRLQTPERDNLWPD